MSQPQPTKHWLKYREEPLYLALQDYFVAYENRSGRLDSSRLANDIGMSHATMTRAFVRGTLSRKMAKNLIDLSKKYYPWNPLTPESLAKFVIR